MHKYSSGLSPPDLRSHSSIPQMSDKMHFWKFTRKGYISSSFLWDPERLNGTFQLHQVIYVCIHHVFLFSLLLMLWHLRPSWPWKNCASQSYPVPRDSKLLTYEHTFFMQVNQCRAHIPTTFFLGLSQSCFSLITLELGTGQSKTAPLPQSLLKLFKLALFLCLAHSFPEIP